MCVFCITFIQIKTAVSDAQKELSFCASLQKLTQTINPTSVLFEIQVAILPVGVTDYQYTHHCPPFINMVVSQAIKTQLNCSVSDQPGVIVLA